MKRNEMNSMRSMKWGFAAVVAGTIASMPGCELLVQFDRNLIDGGAPNGTVADATTPGDALAPDAPSEGAVNNDAGGGAEASGDALVDAPAESEVDAVTGDDGSTEAAEGDDSASAADAIGAPDATAGPDTGDDSGSGDDGGG